MNHWFGKKETQTPSNNTLSDLHLKKHIVYITDKKWNNLRELTPVEYYYTHDMENQTPHFGFIAQEVEQFFPNWFERTCMDTKLSIMSSLFLYSWGK